MISPSHVVDMRTLGRMAFLIRGWMEANLLVMS